VDWADVEFVFIGPEDECPICGPSQIHDHPSAKNGTAPLVEGAVHKDLPAVAAPGLVSPRVQSRTNGNDS
jgi:hypothetical protein